ncbi:hypothetical protein [Saccharothrix sp.]|uniref:hypothetical protein n=1 Tax=Saccharothrix sp. TaxID=1873460 RepID=UPI002811D831|nr:hypothetical protein [Saccharothrix sp.]
MLADEFHQLAVRPTAPCWNCAIFSRYRDWLTPVACNSSSSPSNSTTGSASPAARLSSAQLRFSCKAARSPCSIWSSKSASVGVLRSSTRTVRKSLAGSRAATDGCGSRTAVTWKQGSM